MALDRAYFVVIDGPRGTGKSTLIKGLKDNFDKGVGVMSQCSDAVFTREVGGCPASEHIRKLFEGDHGMDPMTELLLINAARRENILKTMMPAYNDPNYLIVCDRWFASTYAYQCHLKGVATRYLERMHSDLCWGIQPDLTLILDLPTKECMERTKNRKYPITDAEKQDKIRAGYRRFQILSRTRPEWGFHIETINAVFSKEGVLKRAMHIIGEHHTRFMALEPSNIIDMEYALQASIDTSESIKENAEVIGAYADALDDLAKDTIG